MARHHPFAAEIGDVVVAVNGVQIQLAGGVPHQFFARRIAEDAGHSVVAIEDLAVDGVAIDAGEVALEQEAMPLLAAAHRGLSAVPLDGVDEDLPTDSQQRNRVVAPRPPLRRRHSKHAEKGPVIEHRHDGDGAVAGALVPFTLRRGFGWKVVDREVDLLEVEQLLGGPGECR